MASVTEMVHLGAQIERSLRDELKALAQANERSVGAEVRLALRAHVERSQQGAAA